VHDVVSDEEPPSTRRIRGVLFGVLTVARAEAERKAERSASAAQRKRSSEGKAAFGQQGAAEDGAGV